MADKAKKTGDKVSLGEVTAQGGAALPYDELHRLMKMVSEMGLAEIQVKSQEIEIRIVGRREAASALPVEGKVASPASPRPPAESSERPDLEGLHLICSPMVGTLYRRPQPDANPFVESGRPVRKGQVVCIIEAMKLMNEIEADVDGVIEKVLVEDAQPVEFGQPLLAVRPS